MTLENYNYRNDPLFLRNQFDSVSHGKFRIPIIKKSELTDDDFMNLLLLGFDRTKADDGHLSDRIVHFFLYDYKFESIWKTPDKYIERLKPYKAVLSPDFSMYTEMNPAMQLYNVFRNRWCGAYLVSKGLRVIPTVSWGDENTFDFCFLGIPKGSTVAVSTYMVSEHDNHKDQKEFFLKGYNEMLRQIEPERIICYNTPFPEMEGNIVFVDYELSSWKYQDNKQSFSKYVKYITGELPLPDDCDIIIKKGFVDTLEEKGMGSSRGGEWRPKKEEDERFLGKPGEIKRTFVSQGYWKLTKIGDDGRAVMERHLTDHNKPWAHSDPHDHKIDWSKGTPHPNGPINYYDEVPEFKKYKGEEYMCYKDFVYQHFESISDFKWCMHCGGEVQFHWKGKSYSITHGDGGIGISEGCYMKDGKAYNVLSHTEYDPSEELVSEDVDEILEYSVGGDRLRDIITKVLVTDRTI